MAPAHSFDITTLKVLKKLGFNLLRTDSQDFHMNLKELN